MSQHMGVSSGGESDVGRGWQRTDRRRDSHSSAVASRCAVRSAAWYLNRDVTSPSTHSAMSVRYREVARAIVFRRAATDIAADVTDVADVARARSGCSGVSSGFACSWNDTVRRFSAARSAPARSLARPSQHRITAHSERAALIEVKWICPDRNASNACAHPAVSGSSPPTTHTCRHWATRHDSWVNVWDGRKTVDCSRPRQCESRCV